MSSLTINIPRFGDITSEIPVFTCHRDYGMGRACVRFRKHRHRESQLLLLSDWCADIDSNFFISHLSGSLDCENAVT